MNRTKHCGSAIGRSIIARRLIGLLVLATLAGCTSIPRSGPVVVGQAINSDPREGLFQPILQVPLPGESPADVVRGFINASVGFGDDHSVARRFLAPARRLTWSPDAAVDIYPGQSTLKVSTDGDGKDPGGSDPAPSVSGSSPAAASTPAPSASVPPASVPSGPASSASAPPAPPARPATTVAAADQSEIVTVTTEITGSIDADGRYTQADPGEERTRRFELIRSEGEWRIGTLDDGILVSSSDFAVTFRAFPVYFADLTGRYLVPDVHWLPANRNDSGYREVPTALVDALLAGPSSYLKGAVTSGAPAGTRMAVAAVVVSDQVATVDLTEEVRRASVRDKQLLLSQLRATLGIGSISGVQITVRRTPLDIPAQAARAGQPGDPAAADGGSAFSGQPQTDPQVDDDPVVLDSKGAIARLSGQAITPVVGVEGLTVPGGNRPALSAGYLAYAVLNGDRSRLLLQFPSAKASTLVRGTMLTGPSFDPWGWVWTSEHESPEWVSAARPDPGRIKVSAPWLKGKSVIALRISREGARALVAIEYRGQAHIFIAGVVRDENGQPIRLTQPMGMLPDLQTVTDASWMDEDQIVVLGHRQDREGDEPWIVQIGGLTNATAKINGAQSVSAANGELGLMVGTKDGTLTRVGRTWRQISTGRWATYAG